MSVEGEQQASATLRLHQVYIAELREHALALVWFGYQRMGPGGFAVAEEDDITGELVRYMKSVIEDETAPVWADHYSVTEQVRSTVAGRFGKRRPIVDVEFKRHKLGPRPRLRFEAKRLCRSSGVSDYLGDEGLRAFLLGHYATTHCEAGMLGYVQTETEAAWADKIALELAVMPKQHRLTDDGAWTQIVLADSSHHTYQTKHFDGSGQPMLILHVLLRFGTV